MTLKNSVFILNTGYIFHVTRSAITISSCVFYNSGYYDIYTFLALFKVLESNISIADSFFDSNVGNPLILLEEKSRTIITGSRFTSSHDVSVVSLLPESESQRPLLEISFCTFESNTPLQDVVQIYKGHAFIYNTIFHHNSNPVNVHYGSVEFTDCTFNGNVAEIASVYSGSLRFMNCSFWNNTLQHWQHMIESSGDSNETQQHCLFFLHIRQLFVGEELNFFSIIHVERKEQQ